MSLRRRLRQSDMKLAATRTICALNTTKGMKFNMTPDGKLLLRARENLSVIKTANREEHERRRREVFAKAPSIAAIEKELHVLIADVVSVALKNSADPEAVLKRVSEKSMSLIAEKAELLVKNGFDADYLEDIVSCQKCSDTGYDETGKTCPCLLALYEKERAKELSVLTKLGCVSFLDFKLDYYDGGAVDPELGMTARQCMEFVLDSCRRYAMDFGKSSPNLLFRGGTGLGKTMLSACIAKEVSGKGFSVVYETSAAAFEAFENRKFSRDEAVSKAADEKVLRILECDLLILDDLGTEMTTSFTQSALYTIINTRLSEGLKTIVSTNLSKSETEARYTPQIASRLSGEFDTLLYLGRDIRSIKKEQRYV